MTGAQPPSIDESTETEFRLGELRIDTAAGRIEGPRSEVKVDP